MISYVLLIVIAVGLAALIFVYLQVYVPRDKVVCPDDISISIENYICQYDSTKSNLTLTLTNKGLFTLDAVYVRVGQSGKDVKELINDPNVPGNNINDFYLSPGITPPAGSKATGLLPGESATRFYHSILITSTGEYGLEIQPAVKVGNKLAICEKAVISQKITCA